MWGLNHFFPHDKEYKEMTWTSWLCPLLSELISYLLHLRVMCIIMDAVWTQKEDIPCAMTSFYNYSNGCEISWYIVQKLNKIFFCFIKCWLPPSQSFIPILVIHYPERTIYWLTKNLTRWNVSAHGSDRVRIWKCWQVECNLPHFNFNKQSCCCIFSKFRLLY